MQYNKEFHLLFKSLQLLAAAAPDDVLIHKAAISSAHHRSASPALRTTPFLKTHTKPQHKIPALRIGLRFQITPHCHIVHG